jgi:hypothetical protein
VPKIIVHDISFKASLFANTAVVIVPFAASSLPISVQQELDAFNGLVIYMEEEYLGPSPRLENNFHNTTIDAVTGKRRAQISREKLWNLMTNGQNNPIVSTQIEIPSGLPEKPVPLASYEYGIDPYGNNSIIAILLADVSWHDLRKHAFNLAWNNGLDYQVQGACARQNLLYKDQVTNINNSPYIPVSDAGYRRILDQITCPNGINLDCYFVEYSSPGVIPPSSLPAQGQLIYYAGYPPVWGNTRAATITFDALQKPTRIRQLLLNKEAGVFDPIDIVLDSESVELVPFEQGSIVQAQLEDTSAGYADVGICIPKNQLIFSDENGLYNVFSNLASQYALGQNAISVLMRCGANAVLRSYDANTLFTQMAADILENPASYQRIFSSPGSVIVPSDVCPIGFLEANSISCYVDSFTLGAILFQNEGICSIAKRIPILSSEATALSGVDCNCINEIYLDSLEAVSLPDFSFGSNRWQPTVESQLFVNNIFADGYHLVIRPVTDNLSSYFNRLFIGD